MALLHAVLVLLLAVVAKGTTADLKAKYLADPKTAAIIKAFTQIAEPDHHGHEGCLGLHYPCLGDKDKDLHSTVETLRGGNCTFCGAIGS